MRAVVLDGPGPAEALVIRDRPIPVPLPGQVLIRVRAFGLNRSELHTRLGLAEGVTFPVAGKWQLRMYLRTSDIDSYSAIAPLLVR